MANRSPAGQAGTKVSTVVSRNSIGVRRMPQIRHMKTLFNNQIFRQYRIVRK